MRSLSLDFSSVTKRGPFSKHIPRRGKERNEPRNSRRGEKVAEQTRHRGKGKKEKEGPSVLCWGMCVCVCWFLRTSGGRKKTNRWHKQ